MTLPGVALAVVLASFAAGSLGASGAILLAWPRLRRRLDRKEPGARACRLLALRLAPTAFGLWLSLGVVVPSFLAFEPARDREPVGPAVLGFAAAGLLLVAAAAARLARAARRTFRAAEEWQRRSSPEGLRAGVPVWRLDDALPVAVLAGLRRPRIFIASRILERLDDPQIGALAAHELAHHEGQDNAKRLLANACADPLAWTRTGREISSDWELALEESADARAVCAGAEADDLADALVAVARLHRGGAWLGAHAAAFYRGGGLEKRVKRLLDEPAQPDSRSRRGGRRLWTGVLVAAAVWMVAVIGLARPVHAVIERAVQAGTSANYEPW